MELGADSITVHDYNNDGTVHVELFTSGGIRIEADADVKDFLQQLAEYKKSGE